MVAARLISVGVEGVSSGGTELCEFMNHLPVIVIDFDSGKLFNALGHHVDLLQTDGLTERFLKNYPLVASVALLSVLPALLHLIPVCL